MSSSAKANPLDLSGRRALVTGASRGIGAAIAKLLAENGAHVHLGYREDERGAEATRRSIEETGGRATLAKGNLARPEEIRALVSAIGEEGPLDILVHNAALGSFKDVLDVRANQWDLTLAINARALLHLAQEARPLLEGRGSSIVAVSSLGSTRVVPSYGAIGVSKAALEALVRSLAVELAPKGIRVNAVSAGLVDTASVRLHPDFDALEASSLRRTPLGRLGAAEDVARAVLFLVSPLAAWVVGQTLVADGGLSLSF